MNLSGKVALVTGSGRGIGQAIALRLAEAGANIVVNDVGEAAPVEAVCAEIRAMGREALPIMADVSSAGEVEMMVEQAVSAFGRIDILVNNAGIARDKLLLRMSEEDWDKVLAVDLKSVFLCTKAVLRHMLKQGWGRVINISSVVGIIGNSGQANYAAAKAGIIGFTRSVAKEVASRGITVNAIAPGFIETQMTRGLKEEWREELKRRIPVGSFGSPRDVANAVAFLASDEAAYITGQVLGVDGGMAMSGL